MSYAFSALRAEYTALLIHMKITRQAEVNMTAEKLLHHVDEGRYAEVSAKTGIPQIIIAASFEREASSNFSLSPAQGDPWNRRSVHVPRGRGPFINWTASAIDAYHLDHLDAIGASNWSWERVCFEEELFNGFGPRMHGRHSGYLWAGTNAYASGGKYVADGVWNPHATDQQLGVIPVMYRMVKIRPSLTLPIAFPSTTSAPTLPDTPQAAPTGLRSAAALQAALNKLGVTDHGDLLDIDGNYGRHTKRAVIAFQKASGLDVDGIAGAETWFAINNKIKALDHPVTVSPPSPLVVPTVTPPTIKRPSLLESVIALFKRH
jgi:lysozyme family protein